MTFNYYMPTKLYVGSNVIEQNGHVFKEFGKKALIVTGKKSAKLNGSLSDVENQLKKNNIEYVIFDEIEENPSLETVAKAVNFGLKEVVEFIVGIGGGSPIDASKAIGVLIKNPDYSIENIFSTNQLKSIPIIAVPTTAGTGTEATQYSIVTDNKAKTKRNLGHNVFPEISFLDYRYMESLSYDVTVNTSIDAFSHLVEAYLNTNANVMSDMYCEKGLKLFGECLPLLLDKNLSKGFREKMMMASTIGGMAIAQVGTSLPHGMGYHLTYFKGMPHGIANGVLYKEYLNIFRDKTKVYKMLDMINVKSLDELGKILDKLIKVDIVVNQEEVDQYTKSMVSNEAKLKNHPEKIGFDEIYNIYANTFLK